MDNVEALPPTLDAQLETYCCERPEITAAYLFGSQAKGTATAASDVDVALLLAVDFDLHQNYAYHSATPRTSSGFHPPPYTPANPRSLFTKIPFPLTDMTLVVSSGPE